MTPQDSEEEIIDENPSNEKTSKIPNDEIDENLQNSSTLQNLNINQQDSASTSTPIQSQNLPKNKPTSPNSHFVQKQKSNISLNSRQRTKLSRTVSPVTSVNFNNSIQEMEQAAEAAEEFNNEQIEQILNDNEENVKKELFNQTTSVTSLENDKEQNNNIKDNQENLSQDNLSLDSLGLPGNTASKEFAKLTQMNIITFSSLYSFASKILKNTLQTVKKSISLTDNVVNKVDDVTGIALEKVNLTLWEKCKLVTRNYYVFVDNGIILAPVGTFLGMGLGNTYSMSFLHYNFFQGNYFSRSFYTFYSWWQESYGWIVMGCAPYSIIWILYQQRRLENNIIFGNLKDTVKREIKLAEVRDLMQNLVDQHVAARNDATKSTVMKNLNNLRASTRRRLHPDTDDWESISENKSVAEKTKSHTLSNTNTKTNRASQLMGNFCINTKLKFKEEQSAIRIISDIGWTLFALPIGAKLVSKTNVWNLLWKGCKSVFSSSKKSFYQDIKNEVLDQDELSPITQVVLSSILFLGVKSAVRIYGLKSLLK